jgi:AcrR family transcriptional regulator
MFKFMAKAILSKKPDAQRLSKSNWTDASISTLLDEGIDAVQITRLARKLGVSRGSFYWHFEDRPALLKAMVDVWRERNSDSVMQALDGVKSLSEGVLGFFSLWVDSQRFSPELEQSVRDWARLDESANRPLSQRMSIGPDNSDSKRCSGMMKN